MAPVKPLLLASYGLASALAYCTGDSCEFEDQTALLQSHVSRKTEASLLQTTNSLFPKLSNLNDPHTRKSALLEMEKTAVDLASMDRSQATDIVLTVCTETAELLNTTVLYSIIEEDAADRASLAAAYAGFEQWETQRLAAEEQLAAAAEVVSQRAFALSVCRTMEIETCVNETVCTMLIDQDCIDRDRLEEELLLIDEEIHRSWCQEGAVRTHTEFRSTTVSVFHRYTEKWTELEIAQGLCDDATEHCESTLQRYMDQATRCSVKQAELQMGSCEYHHVAAGALEAYQNGFLQALGFYNDIVARVMIMEADRKVEWDVLTRVICLLLTLTSEGNGIVSSDETAARIQRCWDDFVDVSHLDIDYLDPPPMLGLPDLPPMPCTATHIGGVELGPPIECGPLISLHHTESRSECTCLADAISEQGLILGFYLLVDPAISLTALGDGWSVELDGETYTGFLSAAHAEDFSALSAEMMNPDDIAQSGNIASIAWAYPSLTASQRYRGPMGIGERFATRGGLIFMNAAGEVILTRELASSSGLLGQPVSATLSFSSAEEITDEQAAAACPTMQDVAETSRPYWQGARQYCWIMGSAILSQCANGCFVYNMVYGKVAYPVMGGLHLFESHQ